MDNTGQILLQTSAESLPEFVRLAFAGLAGGLLGAYINDRLTRRRENDSGIVSRKRDFLVFMRTWRIEIDRKHFLNSMYKWEKSSFTELVSAFRGTAETIRGDFAGDKRKEFEALIATVTSYDANNFNNEQEHQKLLKAIDEIIAIVEVARP